MPIPTNISTTLRQALQAATSLGGPERRAATEFLDQLDDILEGLLDDFQETIEDETDPNLPRLRSLRGWIDLGPLEDLLGLRYDAPKRRFVHAAPPVGPGRVLTIRRAKAARRAADEAAERFMATHLPHLTHAPGVDPRAAEYLIRSAFRLYASENDAFEVSVWTYPDEAMRRDHGAFHDVEGNPNPSPWSFLLREGVHRAGAVPQPGTCRYHIVARNHVETTSDVYAHDPTEARYRHAIGESRATHTRILSSEPLQVNLAEP